MMSQPFPASVAAARYKDSHAPFRRETRLLFTNCILTAIIVGQAIALVLAAIYITRNA